MTSDQITEILPPLSRLNAWCRVPYEQQLGMDFAAAAIYRYKLRVIRHAVRHSMATLRLVQIEMSCLTCNGTGEFTRDEDHCWPEDCRRCGASGRVLLTFVESSIGAVRWHTPLKTWDPFIASFADVTPERVDAGDWKPGETGDAVLARMDLIDLLNTVERIICGGKLIRYGEWPHREYTLDLGEVAHCVFCERTEEALTLPWRTDRELHKWPIYRPGFRWHQGECRGHAWKHFPAPWPLSLKRWIRDPQWEDYAPPPPLATHPSVTEWLARRGIVIGKLVPADYAYTTDAHIQSRVLAALPDGRVWVELLDAPFGGQWSAFNAGLLSPWPRKFLAQPGIPAG